VEKIMVLQFLHAKNVIQDILGIIILLNVWNVMVEISKLFYNCKKKIDKIFQLK